MKLHLTREGARALSTIVVIAILAVLFTLYVGGCVR